MSTVESRTRTDDGPIVGQSDGDAEGAVFEQATQTPRRRYVVDPQLQLRFVALMSVYMLLTAVGIVAALIFPVLADLYRSETGGLESVEAGVILMYLNPRLWPVAGASVLLMSLHALIISHRVAGPLYRLSAVHSSIRIGEIPGRVRSRRNDFLKEEVRLADGMVDSLNTHIAGARRAVESLKLAVEDVDVATVAGSRPEQERSVAVLKAAATRVEREISFYKVA